MLSLAAGLCFFALVPLRVPVLYAVLPSLFFACCSVWMSCQYNARSIFRPLIFAGRASYSIFLIHLPLLTMLVGLLTHAGFDTTAPAGFIAGGVSGLVICMAMSVPLEYCADI
jgi:peptidoglycan/LPS O-acetylase OafA/YrhL